MENFPINQNTKRATFGREAGMAMGSRVLRQNSRPGCVNKRQASEASRQFQI